ncbi:hypothetical protein PUN4_830064 [Paraburkholderia unamae]|nr:hypothetical protein PUN4_830064 [Paraburkholderia unamae]
MRKSFLPRLSRGVRQPECVVANQDSYCMTKGPLRGHWARGLARMGLMGRTYAQCVAAGCVREMQGLRASYCRYALQLTVAIPRVETPGEKREVRSAARGTRYRRVRSTAHVCVMRT